MTTTARVIGGILRHTEAVEVACSYLGASDTVTQQCVGEIFEGCAPDKRQAVMAALRRRRWGPPPIQAGVMAEYLRRLREQPVGPWISSNELYLRFCEWYAARNRDVPSPSQKHVGDLMACFPRRRVNGCVYFNIQEVHSDLERSR
jgi:hypothetical protein